MFTPIKTEIFKMQVKAFEEILGFFQNRTETDFTTVFDFNHIVYANSTLMFTEFIEHFYKGDMKIDDEKVKSLHESFHGAIVTQTWAEKNFVAPEYFENKTEEKKEDITNPAIILEHWKKYEYGPINFSKKYFEETEKLNLLIASPLIPVQLKTELEKFDNTVKKNLYLVGITLNEIAQELPHRFPTASSLKKFEKSGIWNKYNKQKKDLEPIATSILAYIRTYLKIDKLVD